MSAMPVFYKLFLSCCLVSSVISYGNCSSRDSETICPPNEIYVPCVKRCNTCKERGNCAGIPESPPGCDCLPGYLRNDAGRCIPENQCEPQNPICPPGQEYRVCSCDQNCCNRGNAEVCGKECLSGCFCRRGTYRDNRGNCVRLQDCPPSPVIECPLINCVSGCTLDNSNKPCPKCVCPEDTCPPGSIQTDCVPCTPSCRNSNPVCTLACRPGCACLPGLIYDDFGNCIFPQQCPKAPTCGPNSKPTDCVPCTPTCNDSNPFCTAVCKPGCACDPGYIKDNSGNCILPKQCPGVTQTCPPGSIPTDCVPCTPSCKNPNPVCAAVCNPGCACLPGLIYDDFGNCIFRQQCPPKTCGPNSHISDCGSLCPPTCEKSNRACPAVCVENTCVCDPGFVLDKLGSCIPEDQCPGASFCGPNSRHIECAPLCPPTCNNPNPVCEPGCVKDVCVCNPGFLKDAKGNCIPADQCPKPSFCGPNEFYSDCVNPCNNCEDKGNCNFLVCNKGCDCLKGFYRNNQNKCIPEFQCPKPAHLST